MPLCPWFCPDLFWRAGRHEPTQYCMPTTLPWSPEHSSTGAHHGAIAARHRIRKHFPFLFFLPKTAKCLWGLHREEAGFRLLINPHCKKNAVNSFRRGEVVSSDSCIYSVCTVLYRSQAIFIALVARWLCKVTMSHPKMQRKNIQWEPVFTSSLWERILVFWWPVVPSSLVVVYLAQARICYRGFTSLLLPRFHFSIHCKSGLGFCRHSCFWDSFSHRITERVRLGGTPVGPVVQPPCSSRVIPDHISQDYV